MTLPSSRWDYTDLYSHKIVGACLHPDLSVRGTLAALHQALPARTQPQRPLIHHSDRGLQYAAREYVGLLESHGVALSMTQHGDPYENAVAERVNGILKDEFGLGNTLPSCCAAACLLRLSVAKRNASALKAALYLRRLSGVVLLFFAVMSQEIDVLPLCASIRPPHGSALTADCPRNTSAAYVTPTRGLPSPTSGESSNSANSNSFLDTETDSRRSFLTF